MLRPRSHRGFSAERASRWGLMALAGVTLLWGGVMVAVEAAGSSGPEAARTGPRDVAKPVAAAEREAAERAERVAWFCRPDLIAITRNVRTDQVLQAARAGAAQTDVREAGRRAATAAVLCSPLDAAAWLLLAMTSGSGDPSGSAVRSALELSYWTGTLDPALLMRRILFVERFVQAGGRDFAPPLEDDIGRLIGLEADEAVALVYRDGAASLRPKLRAAVERLQDPVRRGALLAVFDRLDAAVQDG